MSSTVSAMSLIFRLAAWVESVSQYWSSALATHHIALRHKVLSKCHSYHCHCLLLLVSSVVLNQGQLILVSNFLFLFFATLRHCYETPNCFLCYVYLCSYKYLHSSLLLSYLPPHLDDKNVLFTVADSVRMSQTALVRKLRGPEHIVTQVTVCLCNHHCHPH